MKKLVICFLLCSVFLNGAQAQESALETRDVEVMFYLIDIEQINNVSQSFVANLYMEISWHDSDLANIDRLNKARKVDLHARWIAPLIYSAVLIQTFYLGIGS